MNQFIKIFTLFVIITTLSTVSIFAQDDKNSTDSNIRMVKIKSHALEGNLIGDPSIREMAVLLPPTYFISSTMKFPTVYYLHGLSNRKAGHLANFDMLIKFYKLMKEKKLKEMVIVAVDGTTVFGGSYFTDSPTIGNFEEYICKEIVTLIDSMFRTIPYRNSRAIAGFSMGGYGAIKLGMKYSQTFSRLASLSGSPLSMRYRKSIYKNALANHTPPRTIGELSDTITFEKNWSLAAAYAKAAAFSPNPAKPPLFLDLPFQFSASDDRDPVWQKWLDDDPLSLVAHYQSNLRKLDQIYIDHGDDETTLGTEDFIRELVRYGIGFTHYVFRGDHVDELYLRHVRMLQFLSIHW
ncbi:MAG: esterase family protein [Acidobacteria bacterium]|nr:esterase family protein [Acidobacteriota bacterium]MBU4307269.1 esterase family protein [Acidobacteriota bacterium]